MIQCSLYQNERKTEANVMKVDKTRTFLRDRMPCSRTIHMAGVQPWTLRARLKTTGEECFPIRKAICPGA